MISRTIFAAVFLASTALAAPRLTTIQDVLYKADGTRFNGTLVIAWSSFQAGDASQIATQTTSAKVVDGNLRVQLVPTDGSSPRMVYTVTYNSDGRVQFQETWAVPASAQPVRLRDIRVDPSTLTSTDIIGGNGTTSVQESDVVGLTADLGARPLKGPGYAAGRLAFVNSSGAIEGVTGSPIDCVRVDGTATSCGGGGSAAFVDADTPSGIVDGANTQFNLSEAPDPASSLSLYRNGLLMSGGQDYSLNGQTLTFVSKAAPQPGDTLVAWYRLTAADDLGVSFIDGESPTGTLDGTNTQFTLSALPTPISSLVVFAMACCRKSARIIRSTGNS